MRISFNRAMKLSLLMLITILLGSFTSGIVYGKNIENVTGDYEVYETTEIPMKLNPGEVIKFISDREYIILEEGSEEELEVINENTVIDEAKLAEEEELIKSILEEAKSLPRIEIPMPKPEKGIVVTYNSMGTLWEIWYPDNGSTCDGKCENVPSFVTELKKCRTDYKALKIGTTLSDGTYEYGDNIIVITSRHVLGTGIFTNFTDEKGEAGILSKGDCATKGDIDNPKTGTSIKTRRLNKSGDPVGDQITLTKRDNGCLPDAVLDVWYTGVKYYGFEWSEDLSFNGRYYYEK
ncbi:hypothetical protein [Tissierella praeacuta]|uniref:hypothetical protein n=1 Tax=Tissierella praeacuta TaxID=43131 RepID=UPI00333F8ACB